MVRNRFCVRLGGMILAWSCAVAAAAEVYDLGERRELFVDEQRIESLTGSARLELHSPQPAEVAIRFDAPWELGGSAFVTVFQDGEKVRMYYRGFAGSSDHSDAQVTCVAESADGIHFTRPSVGLIEAGGTKVIMQTPVTRIRHEGGRATAVVAETLRLSAAPAIVSRTVSR